MKRALLGSFLLLAFSFNSCKLDEESSYIKYSNYTNDTIVFFAKEKSNTSPYDGYGYGCTELLPKTTVYGPFIQESLKDTMFFYIVNKSLSDYFTSDKPFNTLVHYHLSVDDIKNLNYTIPYPPTPAMKNMNMIPAYSEIVK